MDQPVDDPDPNLEGVVGQALHVSSGLVDREFGDAGEIDQINKIRYVIEQVIANFKTWRIMHTDYRRPLATFTTTISTVIALHFYATAE
ncbi:MAG: transposase [Streptomycetales bacterium]